MKLWLVGGGGREHAIIKKLQENPAGGRRIYALPGNGGIAADAVCVPDIAATGHRRHRGLRQGARHGLMPWWPRTTPWPWALVDALDERGHPLPSAPTPRPRMIEGSKVFAKDLMKKYGIPTAAYEVFDDPDAALAYRGRTAPCPIVIKADGLALGKGVLIAQTLAGGRGRRAAP